jgi:hypothetical protein
VRRPGTVAKGKGPGHNYGFATIQQCGFKLRTRVEYATGAWRAA